MLLTGKKKKSYRRLFNSALEAAQAGDCSSLEEVFESTTDQELMNNALYEAAKYGQIDCLKLLIEKGSHINYWNSSDDETVLSIACSFKQKNAVMYLLQQGADINNRSCGDRHTALHVCAKAGNVEICDILLGSEEIIVDMEDCFNNTPLMAACSSGQSGIVQLLINNGADARMKNIKKCNSYDLAFAARDADCIRHLLLSYPDFISHKAPGALSPLIIAVKENRFDIVQAFIDSGCDLNTIESNVLTPLHLALEMENLDMIKVLVKGGADVNRLNSMFLGSTPVMLAVCKNNAELLQTLAEVGADLDAFDEMGRTAIYLATKLQHTDCLQTLLKCGADPDSYLEVHNPYDSSQTLSCPTALHAAVIYNKPQEALLLIQAGCDIDRSVVFSDRYHFTNWTPMHLACQREHRWAIRLFLQAGSQCFEPVKHFSNADEETLHLLTDCERRAYRAATLKDMCRRSIRTILGKYVFSKVTLLGLPTPLVRYIKMENLMTDIDMSLS